MVFFNGNGFIHLPEQAGFKMVVFGLPWLEFGFFTKESDRTFCGGLPDDRFVFHYKTGRIQIF